MSAAFEVSADDVATVLRKHGVTMTDAQIADIHSQLDFDAVETAALAAEIACNDEDTLDAQTDAAHEEIASQLSDVGLIPA